MSSVDRPPVAEAAKDRLGLNYWKLWTASVVSNLGDGVAQIAYPWLASAVTRDGMLIALIAVAQRLPWLVFTLPAGVITDRIDRRRIMTVADTARFALTMLVAFAVVAAESGLPGPDEIAGEVEVATHAALYVVLLVASLLFGFAEVLRDNAAQTILPAIVDPEGLERANGRLWGAEMVTNNFVGPPLGSALIGVMFALPFFVDAGTFAVAAGLVFLMTGDFRTRRTAGADDEKIEWVREIKEGFAWLWSHPLLRPMAIILGIMNALASIPMATLVLFAQEVLEVNAFTFAFLGIAAAAGGVVGSVTAPRISAALGSGTALYLTLLSGAFTALVIGLSSFWPVVVAMFGVFSLAAVLWNVITVSLRQTIIPDSLLGRVNSVYRFFAWGMMPVGLALGGVLVTGTELVGTREVALRVPWLVNAAGYIALFVYAAPRLTTDKIEAARVEGIAAKQAGETTSEATSP